MKRRKILALTVTLGLLLVLGAGVGVVWAQGARLGAAVGTAFTYQGQLTDDGDPADGTYDFEFKLHDHPTSDSQVGGTVWVDDLDVSDGLFTVQLDFGSGVFSGEARYLEIGVRAGDSTGAYTTLAPRQELTPAPYAHYALDSLSTEALQGHPVSDTLPTTGQLLQWNGSSWVPATVASGNQPPVAVLQADPAVLMPGQTTTSLILTLSYDPEGSPLTYAFDPTGRAAGAPASFSSASETSAEYSAPGDYLAAGWVKDASGAFDVARALISVYRFWTTTVVRGSGVGFQPSLAVVAGRPAIAYCHAPGTGLLFYVRANDATASSWGTPRPVDTGGDAGQYASLAVVAGHPAIAYYDNSNGDLKYVRSSDATGYSWGTPLTVHSAGDVGRHASLAVVDGRPAIAYYDHTPNYDLKYVRASDAAGSSWPTPLTVESIQDQGQYASLAVVDGRPAIAYQYAWGGYELDYVRASDATGSSWEPSIQVDGDTTYTVGQYASLAVVDGRPDIAYFDELNNDLRYVRANDAAGSSWGTPVVVDCAGDVGQGASLAVVEGRPGIAYIDATNGDLRFAIPRQW